MRIAALVDAGLAIFVAVVERLDQDAVDAVFYELVCGMGVYSVRRGAVFAVADDEIGVKLFAPMPMRAVSVGFAYHGVMYAAFVASETPAIANARRRTWIERLFMKILYRFI